MSKHIIEIERGQIYILVRVPKWSYELLNNYDFWSWKVGGKDLWEKLYSQSCIWHSIKQDEFPFWETNGIERLLSANFLCPCDTIKLHYQDSPVFCNVLGTSWPYFRTYIAKKLVMNSLISRSWTRSIKGLHSRTSGNRVTCWNAQRGFRS